MRQARRAVLIPVKDFRRAKGRLAGALEPDERASLAREMATHVVQAQGNAEVAIACDDDLVAEWATSLGAQVIWCPGTDLNGAVATGIAALRDDGIDRVAIAHSDLPRAGDLSWLLDWAGITIVPDHNRTGTNVLALPTHLPFSFAYGAGSFDLHVREAVRHRCGLRIVHDDDLAWDIDHPVDLDGPAAAALASLRAQGPDSHTTP